MSATTVNAKIRSAMLDSFITTTEASGIVSEAEKGVVTAKEAKAIADLFDRGHRPMPPGMMVTLAIPEFPGEMVFEAGARSALDAFFTKHHVPAGSEKAQLKASIKTAVASMDRSAPLANKPNESRLFALPLTDPRDHARDLPMKTALIDLKKGEFYLKVEGGFVRDPRPKFYGPVKIPSGSSNGNLSQARINEIRGAFNQASLAGLLNYQPGGVIQSHLGVRFERAELMRERHPDGYTYTAYVPVGALSPTAPVQDPNTVRKIYVERTGGFAGMTSHVALDI